MRNRPETLLEAAWIVTGHQPALFHPGVWIKNFAVSSLAAGLNGVGLNLIVDNDVVSVPGIHVPAGRRESPALETILFDAPRRAQAWEEARIQDRTLFASFGERVAAAMKPWDIAPLARDFWGDAILKSQGSDRLSDCLSAARAAMERRWGSGNLERPLSQICETRTFRRFACHLLADLPRFHELHNQILEEYRTRNRVRSRTHPVPDLHAEGEWREAPFWIWRTGDAGRGRVMVRQDRDSILLSNGTLELAALPLPGEPEAAVGLLEQLAAQGWRLRSRALTTTLFARLFLADLFVHGIGGAKYDEMTDQLIARFYGLAPPEFLTLSGTLRLPLEPFPTAEDDERSCRAALRSLAWHPEWHIPPGEGDRWQALLAEKRALIAEQQAVRAARSVGRTGVPSRGPARAARLRQVNAELLEAVGSGVEKLRSDCDQAVREVRANEVLNSREFSLVLFPEDLLRETMSRWVRTSIV